MGFSVKLAPGVRVRASSRGLRTSVGPRAARVHVGGGRTGLSSGVGPVSFYTSTGGGRRRSGGSARTTPAAYQRQVAAYNRQVASQQKAEQAAELAAAFTAILDLHREAFAEARRPVAPPEPHVDEGEIRKRHEKAALAGVGVFQRAARAERKSAAAQAAAEEIAAVRARLTAERQQNQAYLDERSAALLANDSEVVLATLEEAFEDNEAPAAALAVTGGEISLAVLAPGVDAVPDRMPGTTSAGNLTLRKLPKREKSDFYKLMVCGHALATVREAFAVAPGLGAARVVVFRHGRTDAYGKRGLECLLAFRVTRKAFDGVRWSDADAVTVLNDASTELLIKQVGAARELSPLDLSSEPELQTLADAIETTAVATE